MMPTTYTIDNNVTYPMVAQPAPMAQAPMVFMPQMVPAQIPFQPALPTLGPMVSFQNPLLPTSPNGAPMFYNGASFTPMPPCPPILTNLNSSDGCLVPPPGYSFVTVDVPSVTPERSVSVEPEAAAVKDVLLPPVEQNVSRSRSSSVVSDAPPPTTRAEGETTTPPTKQQNKKFRHRSKQVRIMEVHQKLKEEYTAKGLYADEDEVLRGFDTVRVHVKTYKALNRIECPLNDVEKHPGVKVLKIATPFSMKNRFQKKGFIVYLKLADKDMVPIVREIFSHYKEDFAKCDVALKKEDKVAMDKAKAQEALQMDDDLTDITDCSSYASIVSRGSTMRSETDFLSTRAFSREGIEINDQTVWANMMAA